MANPENLKPFTGADDPRRVNGAPKGTLHLSTHIQNALNDPDFELKLKDGSILKEMPIKAIIKTAIAKSVSGDTRAMEWLGKHGYGVKTEVDITTKGGSINPNPELASKFSAFLKDDTKE